jgi:hypothetical protein
MFEMSCLFLDNSLITKPYSPCRVYSMESIGHRSWSCKHHQPVYKHINFDINYRGLWLCMFLKWGLGNFALSAPTGSFHWD